MAQILLAGEAPHHRSPLLRAVVGDRPQYHRKTRLQDIDYESLRAWNPEVVYCHTSSYGPAGPRADWPGYDQLFQASCGWEVMGAP